MAQVIEARQLRVGDTYTLGHPPTPATVTAEPTHYSWVDDHDITHHATRIPVRIPDGSHHIDDLAAQAQVTRQERAS